MDGQTRASFGCFIGIVGAMGFALYCLNKTPELNENYKTEKEIYAESPDSIEESNNDFEYIYRITMNDNNVHYCSLVTVDVNETTSIDCYYDIYSDEIIAFKGQEAELNLIIDKINVNDLEESNSKSKVKTIN